MRCCALYLRSRLKLDACSHYFTFYGPERTNYWETRFYLYSKLKRNRTGLYLRVRKISLFVYDQNKYNNKPIQISIRFQFLQILLTFIKYRINKIIVYRTSRKCTRTNKNHNM